MVASRLTIHLLGMPTLWIEETPLIVHNQKAKALLSYLAATGHFHTRDHLASLLWSESLNHNARHSLRSSLYYIRQVLHAHAVDDLLMSDGDQVYLRLEPDACDVIRFRRLLQDKCEAALLEAVALYHGPLLQDFAPPEAPLFEDWVRFERCALQQSYFTAQQRLADLAEQRQAWDEAIICMQHLAQIDPLSEEVQQRLIRLYVRKGAMGQALHQYHQFEIELWRELGINPASETRALLSSSLAVRSRVQGKSRPPLRLHFEQGELALVSNDYQAAAASAQAGLLALQTVEGGSHLALVGRGHRLFGAALAMEGRDLSSAERHLQEAIAAYRQTDYSSDLCAALFELGNIAAQHGNLRHAVDLYEEAAQTAERMHGQYFLSLAYNNLAYHRLLLGELEGARPLLAKGLELAETYEMVGALLHFSSTQGEIDLYLGNWGAASEAFRHGLALAEEMGNLERQAGYLAGLALAARGYNNLIEATVLLEEALALLARRGYWHLWVRIQLWLADVLLLRGSLLEAEPHLKAGLEIAQQHERWLLLAQGERLYARMLAQRANWQEAEVLFARSLERVANLDLSLECARGRAAWGQALLLHKPHSSVGRSLLSAARECFMACGAQAELYMLRDYF